MIKRQSKLVATGERVTIGKKLIAGGVMKSCECGCGAYPGLYVKTRTGRGVQAGEPRRFIQAHAAIAYGEQTRYKPKSVVEYVVEDRGYATPCWIWQRGFSDTGYGTPPANTRQPNAHRCFYERYIGPIPEGLELDHLCRVRACVNPKHLEPVTHAENVRRGAGCKLSRAVVVEIKRLYRTEPCLQSDLARMFGVDRTVISRVLSGKAWS